MARANPTSILFPVLRLKASSVSNSVFLVQLAYLIRAPTIAAGPNLCSRFRSVEILAFFFRRGWVAELLSFVVDEDPRFVPVRRVISPFVSFFWLESDVAGAGVLPLRDGVVRLFGGIVVGVLLSVGGSARVKTRRPLRPEG